MKSAGPNQYIRQLVHVEDTLLGGLIHGLYPAYLNVKETAPAEPAQPPHAPLSVNALDVCIYSRAMRTQAGDVVMVATTRLYDKRRQSCFNGLPVRRFGHISSNVAGSVHTSVVLSALHRLLVACGDLDNFVEEVARLVADLNQSGYQLLAVWRLVIRFVRHKAARLYGETNPIYVFALIFHTFCINAGQDPPFEGRIQRQTFYQGYRAWRQWYEDRLPC